MQRAMVLLLSLGFAAGCATQFTGNAHVSPERCTALCRASQLEMSGMVYLGEYSSACICEVPRNAGGPSATAVAGSLGGATGVIMQMRRRTQSTSTTSTTAR